MQIAIVGPGRMGSMFAFHLVKEGGHEVTVVARGARLEQLQRDNAIVTVSGERAAVKVEPSLDAAAPYDLVLVMVLASQVEPLLPALRASAAKTIMFMFNTVESLSRLREAVGDSQFAFGFPMLPASLVDGKLKSTAISKMQLTTVTEEVWAKVFRDAGIPSNVEADMESYLRAHAALVIPLMAIACTVAPRSAGLSWAEAKQYERAVTEAFAIVRQMGNRVTPAAVALLSYLPAITTTALLWCFSRTAAARELAELGPGEARSLIDEFSKLAPGRMSALRAIRPL